MVEDGNKQKWYSGPRPGIPTFNSTTNTPVRLCRLIKQKILYTIVRDRARMVLRTEACISLIHCSLDFPCKIAKGYLTPFVVQPTSNLILHSTIYIALTPKCLPWHWDVFAILRSTWTRCLYLRSKGLIASLPRSDPMCSMQRTRHETMWSLQIIQKRLNDVSKRRPAGMCMLQKRLHVTVKQDLFKPTCTTLATTTALKRMLLLITLKMQATLRMSAHVIIFSTTDEYVWRMHVATVQEMHA